MRTLAPGRSETQTADDPLLACLVHVAGLLGQPTTADRLLRGLPIQGERLGPELIGRAAEKAGLKARIVKRRLKRLSPLVLPCVLLLKKGRACVLVGRSDREYQVAFPDKGGLEESLTHRALARDYSGHAVLLALRGDDFADAGAAEPKRQEGHWFWSIARQFWPNYAQIVLAAFLINLLGLAVPLFIMNVYDRVIPNLAITTLWALAAGVVVALAFDFILKMVRGHVIDSTGRRVDMAVQARIFEKIVAVGMRDRPPSAGRLANQIKEFESVADFFTSSTVVAVTDLVFIGVFAFVLWLITGPLVLVPLAAVPMVVFVAILAQAPLSRAIGQSQAAAAARHGVLVESMTGIEAVKTATAEGRMQRDWERAIAAGARSVMVGRFWSSIATNFSAWAQQAVSVTIVVWGVFLVSEGAITVGALIAAVILSGRLLAPLASITATLARAQQAFTAMRGIEQIMRLPDETPMSATTFHRAISRGSIEFKNVTFTYPGSPVPALRDVSFRIESGERVGIIGRVGSGKTTVGRLLVGLFVAQEGLVLVDDADARQFHPVDLRRGIAFASQEAELFSGTLRDNVAFGQRAVTDEEIEEAGRLAGVDEFAAHHPLGYNMPIAERGRSLSGGQKQAVALARMLARKPRVLFLDEPSSAMDTGTEARFLERLRAVCDTGVTLLISTHRATLLAAVNRILVFEQGALAMDGPREEVLKRLARQSATRQGVARVAK